MVNKCYSFSATFSLSLFPCHTETILITDLLPVTQGFLPGEVPDFIWFRSHRRQVRKVERLDKLSNPNIHLFIRDELPESWFFFCISLPTTSFPFARGAKDTLYNIMSICLTLWSWLLTIESMISSRSILSHTVSWKIKRLFTAESVAICLRLLKTMISWWFVRQTG